MGLTTYPDLQANFAADMADETAYHQTLVSLYARLPVFHRTGPAAYNKDLGKTQALLARLGNPERQFRSVHVAGTNGKGSVSSLTAAVLQASGIARVGLFTSPHLVDFAERMRLNGMPAPHAWITEWVARHNALISELTPTFFELNVAMAFCYFAELRVNVAVIEVGLGGRLDSTNVITPVASAITSIGLDHTELLGDSVDLIAAEKAGILKAGVPCAVGAMAELPLSVIAERATAVGAPLSVAESHFKVARVRHSLKCQTIQINQLVQAKSQSDWSGTLDLGLLGDYQLANAATALTLLQLLSNRGFMLQAEDIRRGFANVVALSGIQGRMQVLQDSPLVLADVAHNADGLAPVLAQAERFRAERGGDLHIVFGASADKDLAAALALLPLASTCYYVKADTPRGLDAVQLQDLGEAVGLIGAYYPTVAAGVKAAIAFAEPADVVLVTGSVFVVGEALAYFSESAPA